MAESRHDTWQAIELARHPKKETRPSYASPLHKTVAKIVYEAVQTYDCGPVTYLSLPGETQQRTLLRAGSSPTQIPPQIQEFDTNETSLGAETLAGIAAAKTAQDIGLTVVNVDTAPIGRTQAYTQRLLATKASAPASFSTTPPALAPALETVETHPHAFSVVATQGPNKTLELAIRLVDFTPSLQVASRDALAQTQLGSMSETVDASKLFTNWMLPAQHGWTRRTENRLESDRVLFRQTHKSQYTNSPTKQALTVTANSQEYIQLWKQAPGDPLAEAYERCGVTGRLTATPDQLSAVFPVVSRRYSDSVWSHPLERAPPQISLVTAVQVPSSLTLTETDPTAHATKRTAKTNGESITAFERAVRRWCLERGETVTTIPSAPQGVAFQRTTTDDTRTLAYLTSEEGIHPGRLLAAVWTAYHDDGVSGVSVFAPSQACAQEAATILGRPFKSPSSDTITTLYRQPTTLSGSAGVAVRPLEHPVERWVVTPDNELRCLIDNTVVARGPLTASLAVFAEQFPCLSTDDGTATITQPDGTTTTYETDEIVDAVTPIKAPARPVHLATGRESATILAQNGPDFTGVRYPPNVGALSNKSRDEVVSEFWEQYTIPDSSQSLDWKVVRPEIVSYARHQSDWPDRPPGWNQLEKRYGSSSTTSDTLDDAVIKGRTLRYTPIA